MSTTPSKFVTVGDVTFNPDDVKRILRASRVGEPERFVAIFYNPTVRNDRLWMDRKERDYLVRVLAERGLIENERRG